MKTSTFLILCTLLLFGCHQDPTPTPTTTTPERQVQLGNNTGSTSGLWSTVHGSYIDTGVYFLTVVGVDFSNSNVSGVSWALGFDSSYYDPYITSITVLKNLGGVGSQITLLGNKITVLQYTPSTGHLLLSYHVVRILDEPYLVVRSDTSGVNNLAIEQMIY